jgi:hypothetical protein
MGAWDRVRGAATALLGREQPSVEVTEAAPAGRAVAGPPKMVERQGYEYGIPRGGINEYRGGVGASTQTDRRSLMTQLYEAYLACPWAWACVNAIARTITAGGLVTDWDGDDEEGDQETPPKPENVLALERLFQFCNPREDIVQLMRGVIVDLLVFGDAYLEVVWVGALPVALFSIDSPSMFPIADEHGQISGYKQVTEFGQIASFEARDVIHISLDSPRSGIFGTSPTQALLLPITAWLFSAATAKEVFRKGNPPNIHVDFPANASQGELNRWDAMYAARNIGPRNIGTPIITKGGAKINELQQGSVREYLEFLDQKRDEILAGYGVPPAQAGVIESGNLGGGTGESQRKMFEVNTCAPIAAIVLEKINFHIVKQGFGIEDWKAKFGTVDLRDSKTVEEIRDMRIRNATYTVNKARNEIGEPPVDGGDDAVIIDKQNLVLVRDLEALSTAGVAAKAKGSSLELDEPTKGKAVELVKPDPAEKVPPALAAAAGLTGVPGQPPGQPPAKGPTAPGQKPGQPPANTGPGGSKPGKKAGKKAGKKTGKKTGRAAESVIDRDWREVSEAWSSRYLDRRRQALADLPGNDQTRQLAEHAAEDGDSHSDHDHHTGPDYPAADLGLPDDALSLITVDPATLHVDHEHYQRDLDQDHVDELADKPNLANRVGLLARRPDGSLWIVDGQHHTAAAVQEGIESMTYQVFDSTGWRMEKRVFDAWQLWDNADNLQVRGNDQLAGVK